MLKEKPCSENLVINYRSGVTKILSKLKINKFIHGNPDSFLAESGFFFIGFNIFTLHFILRNIHLVIQLNDIYIEL